MRLQSIYGLFPRILGKGDAAKVIPGKKKRGSFAEMVLRNDLLLATSGYAITYEKRAISDG